MPESRTLLIVKVGEGDPIDLLFETLDDAPDLALATARPVRLAEAKLLLQREELAVALLIGRETEVQAAARELRGLRPSLHIVTVSIEQGTAQLAVQDSNFAELLVVIRSLLDEAADTDSKRVGVTRNYRAHLPPSRRRERARRNLPVPTGPATESEVAGSLGAALTWVEAATRALMEMWLGKPSESPGFVVSWDSLQRWWTAIAGIASRRSDTADRAFDRFRQRLVEEQKSQTPLVRLARLLGDDDIALKLHLIVAASDFDVRFHRLFGVLQDDFGRRYPSLGLACAIIAASQEGATPLSVRSAIAGNRLLGQSGVIATLASGAVNADEPLRLEPRVVDWLLNAQDESLILQDELRLLQGFPADAVDLVPTGRRRTIRLVERRAIQAHGGIDQVAAVLLAGSVPGWLEADAGALAGVEVRIAAPESLPAADAIERTLALHVATANLTGRRLVVDLRGPGGMGLWQALLPLLDLADAPPYAIAPNPAQLLGAAVRGDLAIAMLPPPTAADRRAAVAAILGIEEDEDDRDEAAGGLVDSLSDRFRIGPVQMADAGALARASAAGKGRSGVPDDDDWLSGFRRAAGASAPSLARRIEPQSCTSGEGERPSGFPCLTDVVLPPDQHEQLRAVLRHVRCASTVLDDWGFRALVDAAGIAALFTGESGTGKTMAAHALASELGADLYAIDLANIVSKYIGETEKNLDVIFDDAERAGAVLLFDEADALFGKRSNVGDAHDRYANIEVAYLLQRMQLFPGLAILTTNHPENIDAAFTRRLRFRVDFPRPDVAARHAIWEQSVPERLRTGFFDLKQVAAALDVTGGTIRLMGLHAAMLAAESGEHISFAHVLEGARAMLVRLGSYSELPRLDAIAQAHRAEAA
ncbi:ATP-binding protein [Sphingosinicella sp. BN140058]|uniref:AAA family ATPase n=1 Tax=Sphingosinicella sp. BN140058 TaxID=1892855 RepID=UPI0013E9BD8C|nr:ATP-binding protein [Sphingosinicella sp. BN140058]